MPGSLTSAQLSVPESGRDGDEKSAFPAAAFPRAAGYRRLWKFEQFGPTDEHAGSIDGLVDETIQRSAFPLYVPVPGRLDATPWYHGNR